MTTHAQIGAILSGAAILADDALACTLPRGKPGLRDVNEDRIGGRPVFRLTCLVRGERAAIYTADRELAQRIVHEGRFGDPFVVRGVRLEGEAGRTSLFATDLR